MTLYYSNYTSPEAYLQATMAQFDLWIPQRQIATLLQSLRVVNFASRASRNIGLAMILGLVPASPYRITGGTTVATGDIRFSTSINGPAAAAPVVFADIFIDCSCEGWQTALSQCQGALQYADRPEEKTMLTDGGSVTESESVNAPNPQVARSQYNDAFQSFRFSVLAMLDLWNNQVGAFNYATFENKYGLVYTITPQSGVIPTLLADLPPKNKTNKLKFDLPRPKVPVDSDSDDDDISTSKIDVTPNE
jgi:hypothetical protein